MAKNARFIALVAAFAAFASVALAQSVVPITGLPPAALPLTGSEVGVVVQGGVTKKATISAIAASGSVFTSTANGLAPASGGGTTNFLRADGAFAAPPVFTSSTNGFVPASGGGTTKFLRADGSFAAPPIAYNTIYDVVKTYGADPTNTADSATAINNAIAACGFNGGIIFFQAGEYKIASAITNPWPCKWKGDGPDATSLNFTCNCNFITNTAVGGGMEDLVVLSTGATSGYAISAEGSYQTYKNISLQTGVYNGIYVSNLAEVKFDDLYINNFSGPVGITCNGSVGGVYGVRINHLVMNPGTGNPTATGVLQGAGCNSMDLFQGFIGFAGNCIDIESSTALFTTLTDFACDHDAQGVYANGGNVLQIVNSYLGSELTGRGIYLTTNFTGNALITNNDIRGNYLDGILVNGGTDVTITSNSIGNNSQASSGTYNGITVASGVTRFTINGNRIGAINQGTGTPAASQNYGVFVVGGASDHYIISNNNLTGNVSGGVSDGGTGTNKSVTGNVQ